HRHAAHHRLVAATAAHVEVDDPVVAATQCFGGQLCPGAKGSNGVLEQGIFVLLADRVGDTEVHAAHLQVLHQLSGELGETGKVTALKAKLGTYAGGSDLLALFFVDRIAAAAALADNHATTLAGALQRVVDGL